MSRRITVVSEEIAEIDLAENVVKELKLPSLRFNPEKLRFESEQYDDARNSTISKAVNLYYKKRRERNIEKINDALKRNSYETTITTDGHATKIVAVQRVYS